MKGGKSVDVCVCVYLTCVLVKSCTILIYLYETRFIFSYIDMNKY